MTAAELPRDRLKTVLEAGQVVTWRDSAFGVIRQIKRRKPTAYGGAYVRPTMQPFAHWTVYVDSVEQAYATRDEYKKPPAERQLVYSFRPATFMVTEYATVVVGMTELELCRRFGLPLPAPYVADPVEPVLRCAPITPEALKAAVKEARIDVYEAFSVAVHSKRRFSTEMAMILAYHPGGGSVVMRDSLEEDQWYVTPGVLLHEGGVSDAG